MSTFSPFRALGLSQRHKLGAAEVQAMIDYLPEAALLVDLKQSIVVLGNSKATELTAYTRAELAGLSLQTLFTPFDGSGENLLELLKSPEPEHRLDILRFQIGLVDGVHSGFG